MLAKYLTLKISSNDKKYSAGAWSPTRPSIVFIGTNDGNIEVWDLLEKTHEPSVVQEWLAFFWKLYSYQNDDQVVRKITI